MEGDLTLTCSYIDNSVLFSMDHLTKEERSRNMAKIKSSNTKPELIVRSLLHRMGFRFRLNRMDLPGKPDLVLPKYKVALFVHGCFWHCHDNCKKAHLPASNIEYWTAKLTRNKERDAKNQVLLEALGWKVIIIWECETRKKNTLQEILELRILSIRTNNANSTKN